MSYMVHNIGIIMTFCIGYVCGLVIDRCAVVTYVVRVGYVCVCLWSGD